MNLRLASLALLLLPAVGVALDMPLFTIVKSGKLAALKFRWQQIIDGHSADFYCAEVGAGGRTGRIEPRIASEIR